MDNFTGNNNSSGILYSLATDRIAIAGALSFFPILPLVLFHFKCFPVCNTSAILLGATLMILTGAISQSDAYQILGEVGNLRTIALLIGILIYKSILYFLLIFVYFIGMMLIFHYFEREGLVELSIKLLLKGRMPFWNYIWRINLGAFILAALFTNDAACVILTPLIVREWGKHKRPAYELDSVLLGIATSANIGSVATVFGNPQMALIASKTATQPYDLSMLDLRRSLIFLGIPALLEFFLNWAFLCLHDCIRSKSFKFALICGKSTDGQNENHTNVESVDDSTVRELEFEFDDMTDLNKRKATKPLQNVSLTQSTVKSKIFRICICLVLLLTVALLLASSKQTNFDIGFVPVGCAVLIMLLDAIINKTSAVQVIRAVDWHVILMFFGIFIWLGGLNKTGLMRYVWGKVGLAGKPIHGLRDITVLCIFVTLGSNVFSNVPLTIIVLEQLEPHANQLPLVLYLAWVATIGGNLTLFGSVANLIVANKSLETAGHRLTFWNYLKFGFLSTMLIGVMGVLVIVAMLKIFDMPV